ncbi:MAG TPA: ribosome silencing factor [Aminobacterium sp.]|jgi:ribosome-associated protein|uniref:ribosome silencing factor n=1 Tax=Aminobacterium TaxID=81466 RepID=UPI000ED033E6|nr:MULTISPECIES: ribosome silencing factor [unclassified Aminobacterium]HCA40324.1 ribosome silencing factor [Aminobacterium sp.]
MIETTELTQKYRFVLDALADKRGLDIVLLDVAGKSSIADTFILVTANSDIHMGTLRDVTEEALNRKGLPTAVEGRSSTQWCLIDAGNLIVHVFSRKGRDFYNLEKVWGDCPSYSYEYLD